MQVYSPLGWRRVKQEERIWPEVLGVEARSGVFMAGREGRAACGARGPDAGSRSEGIGL
jgi:hypothetical protein